MRGGHHLEPDALPDAALCRVPDAAGMEPLLAARLRAGVRGVVDADLDEEGPVGICAGAVVEIGGHVELKGQIAACVRGGKLAVYADRRHPVDGVDV